MSTIKIVVVVVVVVKHKAQNFASWMLSEYTFKIGRKKGNDFLIIVPL